MVPIATIGCGKTTIALALVKLFGWGHFQNDNVKAKKGRGKKDEQPVPTPSPSEESEEPQLDDEDDKPVTPVAKRAASRKGTERSAKGQVSYKEEDNEMDWA